MRKKLTKEEREKRRLKTLSQKIADTKGLLSDKEIFASADMNNYLTRLSSRVLSSVKIAPVKIKTVWDQREHSFVARTNNRMIEINAGCELLDGTKQERLSRMCGLLAHELSHILFTNFTASRSYYNAILNGKLYPVIPTVDPSLQPNLDALLDFLAGKRGLTDTTYHKDPAKDNRRALAYIASNIENIMEDARIEELFSSNYAKNKVLYNGLKSIVKHQRDENLPLPEIIKMIDEKERDELSGLMQIMLQYARFAEIKGYDRKLHKKLPIIQAFLSIQDYIDDFIASVTAIECYSNVNMVLITLFPMIENCILTQDKKRIESGQADLEKALEELIEQIKGRTPSNPEQSGEGTDGENIKQNKPQIVKKKKKTSTTEKSSEEQTGDTKTKSENENSEKAESDSGNNEENESETEPTPSSESKDSEVDSSTSSGKTAEKNEEENENDGSPLPGQISMGEVTISSSDDETNSSSSEDENEGNEDFPEELTYEGQEETNGFREPGNSDGSGSSGKELLLEDYDDEYIYRSDSTINDDIEEDESCGVEYEEGEERDGLGAILDEISESIAKSRTNTEMINSIEDDLKALDASIDYGEIHRGVKCKIVRPAVSEFNRQAYSVVKDGIAKEAKKLAKKCKFIEEDAAPIPVTSYYGKKFMASQVSKQNLKYFQRQYANEPVPQIKVGVLIDESGSMCGNRINAAKKAALLLYHFCELKGIPCAVYGHSTSGSVILRNYADFEFDKDDRYRLMGIEAGGSNRDGYALRFLKEHIAEEDGDKKLLIIISDGQPADGGYYGVSAFMDLKQIVKECEKEGIGIIAAAIGCDKEIIEEIYGSNHFLDIEDLDTLPHRLSRLVQNLLR